MQDPLEEYRRLQRERYMLLKFNKTENNDKEERAIKRLRGETTAIGRHDNNETSGADNGLLSSQASGDNATAPKGVAEIEKAWNNDITVVSWNIDGLDERYIESRTLTVIETISRVNPGVVFLQEVVDISLALIKKKLKRFRIIEPKESKQKLPYFCVVLIHLDMLFLREGTVKSFYFPYSQMGRHIVSACVSPQARENLKITVMTTHLESTIQFAAERTRQFQECIAEMQRFSESSECVIFGGDLNIRDTEVQKAGKPNEIRDVWNALDCPPEMNYTWDTKLNDNLAINYHRKPRCRFDRLYVLNQNCNRSTHATWDPLSMSLLGQEKNASYNMFPSDHFGLLVHFKRTAEIDTTHTVESTK